MKKRLLLFLLLSFPFLFLGRPVAAEKSAITKQTLLDTEIVVRKLDGRAKILSHYLAQFNSPMQYHAQDFIDASDTYNLDWKLLPSIAGVESTFGKHIPGGFNAYGWGVYGTQAIYFSSWRDGMFTVAKGLRENYLNRGLTDPYAINRIYAASPVWGRNVTYFIQDIDRFAKGYQASTTDISKVLPTLNIAAISGQPSKDEASSLLGTLEDKI